MSIDSQICENRDIFENSGKKENFVEVLDREIAGSNKSNLTCEGANHL